MTTERLVRILAATVTLTGVALAHWVHPGWIWLTVFAGANLLQSAFTGFCPPVWLLTRLGKVDAQGNIRL